MLNYLGASKPAGLRNASGAIANGAGVEAIYDISLLTSASVVKFNMALKESVQNFSKEHAASMPAPIDTISNRFTNLKIGNKPVIVTHCVPKQHATTLCNHLK